MGTSSVHRSPATPRWRIVNRLYEDPAVSAGRVLAEIFNAAEQYPIGLSDPGVIARVSAVLDAATAGRWRQDREAALSVARETIENARTAAVREGIASFFGDLADRAVHRTFIKAIGNPALLTNRQTAVATYLGQLLATATDHLCARDLTAHLGSARIAGAAAALSLRQELSDRARASAEDVRLARAITDASQAPRQAWAGLITEAWRLASTSLEDSGGRDTP